MFATYLTMGVMDPAWVGNTASVLLRGAALAFSVWAVPPFIVESLRECRQIAPLLSRCRSRPTGCALERARAPRLFDMIEHLATRVGSSPPERILLNRRWNAAIVPAHPAGPDLLIGVSLLERVDVGDLEAILAHELGHLVLDSWWLRFATRAVAVWDGVLVELGRSGRLASDPAACAIATLALIVPRWCEVRRRVEFLADRIAAAATSPERVAVALAKVCALEADSPASPGAWLRVEDLDTAGPDLLDTHPPLLERIRGLGLDPRQPLLLPLSDTRASTLVDRFQEVRDRLIADGESEAG